MAGVEAVACDMNSDFQEAFEERCPDIQIVFAHFHIIKNFNEKVVNEIRKDEQRRLLEEGDKKAAEALKGNRYILTSKRSTLQTKDKAAAEGKIIQKGNAIEGFNRQLRKVTKSKAVFPTDDSLFTMLHLAMLDITKKWTGHRQDWSVIHAQLAVYYSDRMPD